MRVGVHQRQDEGVTDDDDRAVDDDLLREFVRLAAVVFKGGGFEWGGQID